MPRSGLRHVLAASAALVLAGWSAIAPQPAAAQSALERLEERIRQEQGQPPPPAPAVPAARPGREPGYLGVVADDAHDRGRGVRILEVRPGSPADKAGLKPDDLIVALAEMKLRQMSDMAAILAQVPVGGRVTFEILRGDQRHRIEVKLAQRPAGDARALPQPPESAIPGAPAKPAPGSSAPPSPPALAPPISPPPPPVPGVPGVPGQPAAQPAGPKSPTDPAARVEVLERRIAELEKRIADLEATLRDLLAKGEKR